MVTKSTPEPSMDDLKVEAKVLPALPQGLKAIPGGGGRRHHAPQRHAASAVRWFSDAGEIHIFLNVKTENGASADGFWKFEAGSKCFSLLCSKRL